MLSLDDFLESHATYLHEVTYEVKHENIYSHVHILFKSTYQWEKLFFLSFSFINPCSIYALVAINRCAIICFIELTYMAFTSHQTSTNKRINFQLMKLTCHACNAMHYMQVPLLCCKLISVIFPLTHTPMCKKFLSEPSY